MIPLTSVSAAFVPLASGRRYVIVVHLIGELNLAGGWAALITAWDRLVKRSMTTARKGRLHLTINRRAP
jgi:hypothetical protein